MNILALDLSYTSTGYSVLDMDKNILAWGKINTKNKDEDSKRIFSICEKCEELIKNHGVEIIVVENQFVSVNKNTALKLSRLLGAIMYLSHFSNTDLILITPAKVRSLLLDNGHSSKEEVAEYILGYYKSTNDLDGLGEYSDKSNKNKTSDIYDSIAVGMAFIKGDENGENFIRS